MIIKEIYTITDDNRMDFNNHVKQIVNDLQNDGLVVEVQFSTTKKYEMIQYYSAIIIGRLK